ncbi:metallophosphoesterase [Micromonospora fiedleri]|uniref:Metallophosphoesterase n=1 Tax=Micromonospora fiedleri TaxID=1157498 RepID=A0ABS1UGG8_9ACTN|nr:metallophosphoesterase [Micromonospora fiedleri]MBL6275412.1 metallophosphoesterase [Micromonospora fiedleri]
MNVEVAFVGDVHGNVNALRGLCDLLTSRGGPHMVFLGDYINKGSESAAVMRELLEQSRNGRATLLAGNHESVLREAFEAENLTAFLKMGGAMTIRSYVNGRVGADVLREFRASFPSEHLEALRRMPQTYETDDLIAQHLPPPASVKKFRISGHLPVGKLPRVGRNFAQLDTGCGDKYGRLSALLWPSRDVVQVDARGAPLIE